MRRSPQPRREPAGSRVDAPAVGRSSTDAAVGRVLVGYRLLGAAWLAILGVLVLTTAPGASPVGRPWLLVVTILSALAWAGVTAVLHRVDPALLRRTGFVAADLGIAAWTIVAPALTGSDAFYGGYPFSAVLIATWAAGPAGAIGSAGLLSVVAVGRVPSSGSAALPEITSTIMLYLLGAVVLSWGIGVLRRAEAERRSIEARLTAERAERVRADERAETAAHLHDSVLQTLALVQRQSGDPRTVASLARRQERELRAWIAGERRPDEPVRLRHALEWIAEEVERDHGVEVETVVVGDAPLDERLRATVRAAREALANAARHAQVGQVQVFGEVGEELVEVFVRDRGAGFDPREVALDRRGLRESVHGRMERHGGEARVHSAPGRGTEVELSMPRVAATVALGDEREA